MRRRRRRRRTLDPEGKKEIEQCQGGGEDTEEEDLISSCIGYAEGAESTRRCKREKMTPDKFARCQKFGRDFTLVVECNSMESEERVRRGGS